MSRPTFLRAVIGAMLALASGLSVGCSDSTAPPGGGKQAVTVASVTVVPNTATVVLGDSIPLHAIVRDSAGDTLHSRSVVWATSADTLASVSQTGLVKGRAIGRATVTATSEGKQGSSAITVGSPPIVGWIEIQRSPMTDLTPGATLQLTAWFFDNSGNRLPARPVTWSSNNPSVATVGPATGVVTGVAVGTAFIYGAAPGFGEDHQGVLVLLITGVTETDLGDLGGGWASANGINNTGVVVGQSATISELTHAFRWTTTAGMQDLGTLGGSYSIATAINGTGVIVGVSAMPGEDGHAFRWTAVGGMKDLGVLPGGRTSLAAGINGAGDVVGWSRDSLAQLHAVRWNAADSLQDLGTTAGGTAAATGINDNGEVVGYANGLIDGGCSTSGCIGPVPGPSFAVTWGASGMIDLGLGDQSEAAAVNAQGVIVGDESGPVAFVRTVSGSVKRLIGSYGQAASVNTAGQVAGSVTAAVSPPIWHPVLWSTTGDLTFLSVASGGASGVNDGQQIVGMILDQNNRQRARLWTVSGAIPGAQRSPARRRSP